MIGFKYIRRAARYFFLSLFSVGLICYFISNAESQDRSFDPSYPRTGAFHWGGGRPELYAKYDLIMGGAPVEAKSLNPNMQILPTFGWQAYGYNETQLGSGFDHKNWYLKNANGGDLWAGWNGYYVDFTDYCPRSQNSVSVGLKFNQYLPNYILQKIDLNIYDGVATDWLQSFPWGINDSQNPLPGNIDIDRNGVNDLLEHGEGWVQKEWIKWVEDLISKVRNRLNAAGFSNKPILINSGGFHDFCWGNTNGIVIEYGSDVRSLGLDAFKSKYDQWMSIAPKPHIMLINTTLPHKNAFSEMRYFLGVTLLGDGYFDPEDELSRDHYIKQYYDEMDLNLGYPTGPAYKLRSSGGESIWVRFFDHGVVIVNGIPSSQTITDHELRQLPNYNGPYWRFKGSQDNSFNNGARFTDVTLTGSRQNNEKIGDAIILLKSQLTIIADIIIDNDHLMTSPGQNPASLSGNWLNHQGDIAWSWGRYDWLGHVAYRSSVQAGSVAQFQPKISIEGQYEIFEWHPVRSDASKDVHYEIYSANGIVTKAVNQRIGGGKWNSLGVYHLIKGEEARVLVSGSGLVLADAIKFVYKASQDSIPPNSPSDLKSSNQTESTIDLSWTPPSQASDGDFASGYEVYRDNLLVGNSIVPNYTDTGLQEKTSYFYAIYALDDAGNRSILAATNSFTTLMDVTPPSIVSVRAFGLTSIEVEFSEAVEKVSAENINNYIINNNVTVLAALLKDNQQIVYLTTSEHVVGITYTITVNNIKDRAITPNIIIPNSNATYVGIGGILSINISVDDEYELYFNGIYIGSGSGWETAENYSIPSIAGKNLIAVKCNNNDGVAGLVAEINFNGKHYVSNESWKISTVNQEGWEMVTFEDNDWQKATSYGLHGAALPWAQFQNVQGITTSSNSCWIWSSDNENRGIVYLRFTIKTEGDIISPASPTGLTVVKP